MKLASLLLTAIAPTLLSSCAGPAITQLDADIANANAAKTVACYNAQMQAAWKPDAFADAKDQALIIMAQALASMGRPDQCAAIAGMSVYEARARIAESQNKAAAGITGNVLRGNRGDWDNRRGRRAQVGARQRWHQDHGNRG